MNIQSNIRRIKNELPEHVKLIAVSKTRPAELIMEAYDAGHKIFGENKVQELVDKKEKLPEDIEWHMIGHLQTNKVKYIASFVSLIHGVDSFKLLKEINKQAIKYNRKIPVLLQIHIAREETKFGLDYKEAKELVVSEPFRALKNISLKGLMGMATFTENEAVIRNEFRSLAGLFNELKLILNSGIFSELSMGMSGDYKIAVEEGSTMVRIGSAVFGNR
jgi:PLP dependent protein